MADHNNQLRSRLRLFIAFTVTLAFIYAMTIYAWLSAMYWPDVPFLVNQLVLLGLVFGVGLFLYWYLIKDSIKRRSLEEKLTNNHKQIMPRQFLIACLIGVVFLAAMVAFSLVPRMYSIELPFVVELLVQGLLVIGVSIACSKVLNRPNK